jgi:uncharacterized protein (TIGR03663 family)
MTDVATTVDAATPDEPRRARRRTPAAWFARQDSRELLVWGALIAAAVIVRVIDLGARAFHHDESQDAYFSYQFKVTGEYEYNPLLHGPLRFYLTALMYVLFGDTDFTARLAPVLMGTLMIPLCWALRPLLGRIAAFAAAALLAFGPSFLYFSRFAREDIYVACLTLALIIVIWRYLDKPRMFYPGLIGLLLAALFATKETTFITVFVMGTFFLFALALPHWRPLVWGPVRAAGAEGWGWALAGFAGLYTLLFTTFLTHPGGIDGLYTGLDYWLGQHEVRRGGEPAIFYTAILLTIEWPVVLLGAYGAVRLWKRYPIFAAFLVWDFVVSMIVYSWAGEKFAWLVLHPLLPLILLAGAGIQGLWEARTRAAGKLAIAAALVGLFYVGLSSWWVNAKHGTDPREMLVSTQSSQQVKEVADQVLAMAAARGPGSPPLTVTVDSAEGATFPYAWYFRHLAAGYVDMQQDGAPPPTADALVLTEAAKARLEPALTGYDGRQFDFRVWWVREYPKMWNPTNWFNYVTKREVWNPTGGMKEWLYTRKQGA